MYLQYELARPFSSNVVNVCRVHMKCNSNASILRPVGGKLKVGRLCQVNLYISSYQMFA